MLRCKAPSEWTSGPSGRPCRTGRAGPSGQPDRLARTPALLSHPLSRFTRFEYCHTRLFEIARSCFDVLPITKIISELFNIFQWTKYYSYSTHWYFALVDKVLTPFGTRCEISSPSPFCIFANYHLSSSFFDIAYVSTKSGDAWLFRHQSRRF